MTEIVQIAGGLADQEREYTGPSRELRVDESNFDLLIHDGVTPGGHRLLNQDNSDARYQAYSAELSGIGPFTPEARGFLTRRGPGDYRLRKFAFSTAFTLQNPEGYAGDPTLALSGTIDQPMTFKQDVSIDGSLNVDNGISGEFTGTSKGVHIGNVVGNVSGNLVGNVNGNLTGNSQGKHVGAVDARGVSFQLSDASIQLSWITGLLAYIQANAIPLGTIVIWSGTTGNIPAGWSLCNGLNGTPSLVGSFIRGGGPGMNPGTTGGASNSGAVTTAEGWHNHGNNLGATAIGESQMPSHNHGFGASVPIMGTGFGYTGINGVTGGSLNQTGYTGGSGSHTHGLTILNDGIHSHSVSVPTIPPFYALCYIMKTS